MPRRYNLGWARSVNELQGVESWSPPPTMTKLEELFADAVLDRVWHHGELCVQFARLLRIDCATADELLLDNETRMYCVTGRELAIFELGVPVPESCDHAWIIKDGVITELTLNRNKRRVELAKHAKRLRAKEAKRVQRERAIEDELRMISRFHSYGGKRTRKKCNVRENRVGGRMVERPYCVN